MGEATPARCQSEGNAGNGSSERVCSGCSVGAEDQVEWVTDSGRGSRAACRTGAANGCDGNADPGLDAPQPIARLSAAVSTRGKRKPGLTASPDRRRGPAGQAGRDG